MSEKKIFDAMIENIREYANENRLNILIVAESERHEDKLYNVVVGESVKLIRMMASAIAYNEHMSMIVDNAKSAIENDRG